MTPIRPKHGTSYDGTAALNSLLVAATNNAGRVEALAYDVNDQITNQTDANGVSVGMSYDNLRRLLTRSYPDGGVEKYGYQPNVPGPASYTNQIGNVVLFGYDAMNRKTNEVYVGVATNRFAYNGAGDLLTLTDGKGDTTKWGYDSFGRVTNKVDAAGNTNFVYKYDPDNRLTNRWSGAKGNTGYAYDEAGNLTHVAYPVSPAISLCYDPLNRVTNMVDAVGTTGYGYDAVGELTSEDGPWPSDTVSFTYANRLRTALSLSQPSGSWSQSYGYDTVRRLTSVVSPAGTFSYNYQSPIFQLPSAISLPNGAYITNGYDAVARLLSTALANSGGTNLDSYAYGYNQAGQRTNVVRTAGDSVAYSYDNMGELTEAIGREAGGTTNRLQEQLGYAYDAAGNLNQRTNNALIETFNVNTLNELTTATNHGTLTVAGTTTVPATNVTVNGLAANHYADASFALGGFTVTNGVNGYTAIGWDAFGNVSTNGVTVNLPATNSYSYDLNGNLLSDGTRNFVYDDENELIGVWATNSWSNSFAYDGKMRRRITKEYAWSSGAWAETNEIHFVYDGNLVIQERDANNSPLVTYTRGNDLSGTLQGAGGIGGLLARTDNGQEIPGGPTTAYYHADGNGNVTCLIYADQIIAAKYLYDPYGNTLAMSGPLAGLNAYRFSSKEWDDKSGLYYYLYRFYDPTLQRWLNRDPIGETGGVNLYDLVRNRQVNFTDYFGYLGGTMLPGSGGILLPNGVSRSTWISSMWTNW